MSEAEVDRRLRRLSSYFQRQIKAPVGPVVAAAKDGDCRRAETGKAAKPSMGRNVLRALGATGYVVYIRNTLPVALDLRSVTDSLLAITTILQMQQGMATPKAAHCAHLARALWTLCLLAVFRPCLLLTGTSPQALQSTHLAGGKAVDGTPSPSSTVPRQGPTLPARKRKVVREPVQLDQQRKRAALPHGPSPLGLPSRQSVSGFGLNRSSVAGRTPYLSPLLRLPPRTTKKNVLPRQETADCSRARECSKLAGSALTDAAPAKASTCSQRQSNPATHAASSEKTPPAVPRDPRLSARPVEPETKGRCDYCSVLELVVDELRAEVGLYARRLEQFETEQVSCGSVFLWKWLCGFLG